MRRLEVIFVFLLFVSFLVVAGLSSAQASEGLSFDRSLYLGLYGEDVKDLQEFLSKDSLIYPEGLTTGFFGPLTKRAVERFQEKWEIDIVGIVGPITRAKIKELSVIPIEPEQQVELEEQLDAIATSTSTATTTQDLPEEETAPLDIIVYSPYKGEVLSVSYIRTMRWVKRSFQLSAKISIELVNINDSDKNILLIERTDNDGRQIWQMPNEVGEYKIRITATCKNGDFCGQGESEVFKIVPLKTNLKDTFKVFAGVFDREPINNLIQNFSAFVLGFFTK